jgi:hypothetical protein
MQRARVAASRGPEPYIRRWNNSRKRVKPSDTTTHLVTDFPSYDPFYDLISERNRPTVEFSTTPDYPESKRRNWIDYGYEVHQLESDMDRMARQYRPLTEPKQLVYDLKSRISELRRTIEEEYPDTSILPLRYKVMTEDRLRRLDTLKSICEDIEENNGWIPSRAADYDLSDLEETPLCGEMVTWVYPRDGGRRYMLRGP